jgi:hypothetical protein
LSRLSAGQADLDCRWAISNCIQSTIGRPLVQGGAATADATAFFVLAERFGAGNLRLDRAIDHANDESKSGRISTMPRVRFTQNIQRHVACPPRQVRGASVRQALEAYFALQPEARGYVLDDQGALRQHMAIFVDGVALADRRTMADPVPEEGTVDVLQALSGG